MIVPVILAGGSGSRLWPLSRSSHPKQLLPLLGGHTMLQDTVIRAKTVTGSTQPFVICNQDHHYLVTKQLQEIKITPSTIALEPEGKNTAPAIALAALELSQTMDDPLLLILPADHFIKHTDRFAKSIQAATPYAETGHLITFGITPTHPETGYGYIKAGVALEKAFKVDAFVEKPDLQTAAHYLAAGNYYWNSGMFLFSAKTFLKELALHAPDILAACKETLNHSSRTNAYLHLDKSAFAKCRNESIDYAIMEKTTQAVLVPLDAAWSDIGSWSSLWEVHEPDQNGNVLHGDIIAEQVHNSYLHAESRMLAVVGVNDHVIVETADAVLVAHKNNSQAVKNIVQQMKNKQRVETEVHKKVHRPWGFYEVLNIGPSYQVKRLTVLPNSSLSLQMHYHRSEHWVVVTGTARVRCEETILTLNANESTYIPCQAKHQLANPSPHDILEVIEVQSGDYLGEDDIVRFTENVETVQPAMP